MALALLRSLDLDGDSLVLDVDTGTNPLYSVHLGRTARREDDSVVLDDVYWSSPWLRNAAAGRHLDTRVQHRIDAAVVEPRSLVQVVTGKPGGRATARSTPRRVPAIPQSLPLPPEVLAMSTRTGRPDRFSPPRMVGVRSAQETFTRPASLDDLLGTLVQAAIPAVQALLSPPPGAAAAGAPAAAGAAAPTAGAPAAGTDQLAALLAAALRSVLQSVTGGGLATPSSLRALEREPNRLVHGYARPFLFGIDDALLAALVGPLLSSVAGPLLQALPELVNSANRHRLDSRREDYRMVQELLAGLDRSTLVERLTAAAAASPAPDPGGHADLAPLLALLRSSTAPATAGTPTTVPSTASPATGHTAASHPASVRASFRGTHRPTARAMTASRALLHPVVGPPVTWAGAPRTVLVRDRAVTLRFRLDVGPGGPTASLPRSLLTVVVRDPGGRDLLTREERLTDVSPGGELRVVLDPTELSAVPADTEVEVFAQLRWPGTQGAHGSSEGVVRQATSVQKVVLASGRHVAGSGVPTGDPVELHDMTAFRPFWNKLWSSATPTQERPLWGIALTLRYSVVVVAEQPANGLMEVRLDSAPDGEGLRVTTAGRMKSGLEVSVSEVAKLCALWPGTPTPDAATLAAFAAPAWRATQGGDAVVPVRFDGPRSTRGMLWVVPVPSLRRFPVARVTEVDGFGQVAATVLEQVAFPVLEAVRVLGLVSTGDSAADPVSPGTTGDYAFEGYQVVRSTKVGLEPAAAMAVPTAPRPVSPPPAQEPRVLAGAVR